MTKTSMFQHFKEKKMSRRFLRYGSKPAVSAAITIAASAGLSLACLPAQAALSVDEPIQASAGGAIFTVRADPGSKVFFTLLEGNQSCGSRSQVMTGQNPWGEPVRHGSFTVPMTQRQYSYALGNLGKNVNYVLCLIDNASETLPIAQHFYTPWMRDYVDPSWQQIGHAGASIGFNQGASLVISPDGIPHIAYPDADHENKVTVKKFSRGIWKTVGQAGFSGYGARTPTIVIAPDGTPYVAFTDQASPYNGRATMMKYDGNVWKTMGERGFSNGRAVELSLAISPDGSPFVAYQDQTLNKNVVMKYEPLDGWQTVGMPGISHGASFHNSLVFSPEGIPYLAYRDQGTEGKVTVMKYVEGLWSPVGQPGFSGGFAFDVSLVFSPSGDLYIAYRDNSNYYKASVMRFDTQTQQWQSMGGAASSGSASYTRLVFTPDGNLYLVYGGNVNDGYRVLVKEYNGLTWKPLGEGNISTVHSNNQLYSIPQAAVAPDGTLHVSYSENDEIVVKRYADAEPIEPAEAWHELPALGPMATTRPDIAVGADGQPMITIADRTTGGHFQLMKFNGVNWQTIAPVPSVDSGFSRFHLQLASDGTPFLLYGDNAQQGKLTMLKYDGGQWQHVGEAGFNSSSPSDVVAFQLGADDMPYVAFVDRSQGNRVTVMKYSGNAWQTVGQRAFSEPVSLLVASGGYSYTPYLSLAISSEGAPYVAYRERNEPSKTVVKRFAAGIWQDVGMPLNSYIDGSGLSLAFSPDGILHLAFADASRGAYHGELTVMKYTSQTWVPVGEPISAGEVSTISLDFSADGTPHVLYKNVDEGHIVKLVRYDGSSWTLAGGSDVSQEEGYQMSMAIAGDGTVNVLYNTTGVGTLPMFKVKQLKREN